MPIESPYPPVSVPEVDLWSFYLEHPDRHYPDDHVLYVDVARGRQLTYRQLRTSAERFGSGLQERWAWRKGDVLATMTPNTFECVPGTNTAPRNVKFNPKEDLAFLVYSSGTTGLPKGAMLTHYNMVANGVQYDQIKESTDWKMDRTVGFLPMYHIYGIAVLMFYPLRNGTTTYIMASFDLPTFCRIVQEYKVTFANIVPPVAVALAKHPIIDQFDFSSLRELQSAAAPAPKEIIQALHQRLKVPLRQVYGISEAAPGIASQRTQNWNKPIGCCGHLWPGMSAKIVVDWEEVKVGKDGEICLKGPNIFIGYHANPTATAAGFDSEGWYHTGDVGFIDTAGNISISDRLKELIKYNGFQVAPAQLEDLLLGHAAVADVAVIGVYSAARATELPRAYVVVAAGYNGDAKLEEELQGWFNERVSPYKKLRGGIRFVDVVPKSNAGKILRRVLIEQAKKEEENGAKAKL